MRGSRTGPYPLDGSLNLSPTCQIRLECTAPVSDTGYTRLNTVHSDAPLLEHQATAVRFQRLMFALTPPTRDFVLVTDPHALAQIATSNRGGVVRLIEDLRRLPAPIAISFVFPTYLANASQQRTAERWSRVFQVVANETTVEPLVLSRQMRGRQRRRIERGAEDEGRGLRLLSLAKYLNADGLVTTLPSLTEARHSLSRLHWLRIVPPTELADFVEVCARGHSVFCKATPIPLFAPPDVFYSFADPKARRMFEWFNNSGLRLPNAALQENLRSALLNRYPFILYSRDMVRFFDLQMKYHLRRRGRPAVFRSLLNYHLTAFYVHVWGMLDSLAGIANVKLALGLDPRACYLSRDTFVDAVELTKPGLARFIKEYRAKWIDVMGDVRHPIAHSALLLQQDVVVHTAESRRPEPEVLAIVREAERDFLAALPPGMASTMEALLIDRWRHDRMRLETDDAIYVEHATGGGYFRGPVASLDFDLEMLNAFIDAFLVGCFQ
jgi:hypothetical protein